MHFENEIRREDIAYRLCKALEVRGNTPTLQLDTGVSPVVLIADLSAGSELDFQTNRWAAGWGESPPGAFYPKLSFNNHVDSGILVHIYQLELLHSGGGYVTIGIETSSTGGTQVTFSKSFTDGRNKQGNPGPARSPSVDIRHDNSIGLGAGFMKPFIPAPTLTGGLAWRTNFGGFVLRPGTRLHMEGQDLGAALVAWAEWTETNV